MERYLAGDHAGAINDLDAAIQLEPGFAQAYVSRGAAQDDDAAALADYDEAIRLDPDYLQAYYNRGFLRGVQGDYTGAIADFTQVLQRRPDHPQAGNMRLDIASWRRRL